MRTIIELFDGNEGSPREWVEVPHDDEALKGKHFLSPNVVKQIGCFIADSEYNKPITITLKMVSEAKWKAAKELGR